VELVRLLHGDLNPAGPGLKEEVLEATINGEYLGREQTTYTGSYAIVPDNPLLRATGQISLQAMIWPTAPGRGVQAILTKWVADKGMGYALVLDEQGCLALWLGDGSGRTEKVTTGVPARDRCWYFVGAAMDFEDGMLRVFQEPACNRSNGRIGRVESGWDRGAEMEAASGIGLTYEDSAPFVMAGWFERVDSNGRVVVGAHYNGKIDRPRVARGFLTKDDMAVLVEEPLDHGIVAAWDFAAGIDPTGIQSFSIIADKSSNRLDAKLVNLPTRATTGYNWTGDEYNFTHAPDQYGAIHFHDDDLEDAGWESDFELTVPESLKSAVYAARLHQGDHEDYIPFVVLPPRGTASARIACLVPTISYLAYANNNSALDEDSFELSTGRTPILQAQDLQRHLHREYGSSLYDLHSDGSGVCYSSWRRPILTMRPKYRDPLARVWQFNADLHLIDWFAEMDYEVDVLTDHDLHLQGLDALKEYKVIVTGSHPEYYSSAMLDGLEDYLQCGGRLMYLGGNGFYWVTAYHPEDSTIIEVRRWGGTETWTAEPGERYMSFTGELAGLWRNRGRPPQKLVGVGFIAQGLDVSSYYKRNEDSFHPGATWIFDGIDDDERIGDFGLVGGGAAGLELDSYDTMLGSPRDAFVLASSEGHTGLMLETREHYGMTRPNSGADAEPNVRADMVYFTTPSGGAVFSTGSIAWCASLSHNEYRNNVSRITENVLNRFLRDDPSPA
jgi:N,N-dimethylformamidase